MESDNSTVNDLVERLTKIKQRLFWLAACFANTLSWDLAYEADAWRERFRELADELRKIDADALDRITAGHEAVLFAERVRKPRVPLVAQQLFELGAEIRSERRPLARPKTYGDGLEQFL